MISAFLNGTNETTPASQMLAKARLISPLYNYGLIGCTISSVIRFELAHKVLLYRDISLRVKAAKNDCTNCRVTETSKREKVRGEKQAIMNTN